MIYFDGADGKTRRPAKSVSRCDDAASSSAICFRQLGSPMRLSTHDGVSDAAETAVTAAANAVLTGGGPETDRRPTVVWVRVLPIARLRVLIKEIDFHQ